MVAVAVSRGMLAFAAAARAAWVGPWRLPAKREGRSEDVRVRGVRGGQHRTCAGLAARGRDWMPAVAVSGRVAGDGRGAGPAGVGVTVAAYALFHAVLITPLPYADPGRLVQVWEVDSESQGGRVLRDRDIEVLATQPSPVEGIAGDVVLERALVTGPGMSPSQLVGAHVSVALFKVLGVQAARGRTFRPEDGQLTDVAPIRSELQAGSGPGTAAGEPQRRLALRGAGAVVCARPSPPCGRWGARPARSW